MIYNHCKQNQLYAFIVNIDQPISMRFSSNRKEPLSRVSYQRSTAYQFGSIEQKPQSLQKNNFKSHQVLNKQPKHRRIASYAHSKPENELAVKRYKVSEQNGFNKTYRYLQSKKSFLNNESRVVASRSGTKTQRQTQREKFIKELKNKVLDSHNNSFVQIYDVEVGRQPNESNRLHHWKTTQHSHSRVKSSNSVIDIAIDDKGQADKQSHYVSAIKLKTAGYEDDDEVNRSRAKSFAKDFSKIVEENLNIKKDSSNDYSKTIELNPFEAKARLCRSLDEIQRFENMRVSPTQGGTIFNFLKVQTAPQPISKIGVEQHHNLSVSAQSNTSGKRVNTETYQEEVHQLTNDFFQEWGKMNSNKTELYEKLRNKLVTLYPSMRKKYSKYQLPPQQPQQKNNRSSKLSPALQSSIKISFKNLKSEPSQHNYLTVTQLRERSCEDEQTKQKKNLKEIFKHAYFWSKTKRKYFSTNYDKSTPGVQELKQIKQIQQNLTFMNYVTKKDWKKNPNKAKVRGAHIFKHKESILKLEKEGSPQQRLLKKCLEDAIETCIVENR